MKRKLYRAAALALALLTVLAGSAALAETPQWAAQWKPTRYAGGELNAKTFCTLQTEYPVYKTGVTDVFVLLKNNTKRPLLYGLPYTLEKKRADGWYAQEVVSLAPNTVIAFPAIGLCLFPRTTRGLRTGFFLPLDAGEYRIVKSVGYDDEQQYHPAPFCAYFRVADDGYDPANLSGYVPLSALPGEYTQEQALRDGCFYVDDHGKAYNADQLVSFLTKAQQGIESKLRLLRYDVEGAATPVDISYHTDVYPGRFLLEQDFTRSRFDTGVLKKYYLYLTLRLQKLDGKTVLQLSEWTGKRADGAEEFTVCDAKIIGKSRLAGLTRPYDAPEGAAYCVYSPNGGNWAYTSPTAKGEPIFVNYRLANGENSSVQLPDGVAIGALGGMEWTAEDTLFIAFVSTQGVRYTAVFDASTKGVTLRMAA